MYTSAGDDKDKKIHQKGLNNVVMQLRKICNHPYVFREIEDQINTDLTVNLNLVRCSGKFELLDVCFLFLILVYFSFIETNKI